MFNVFGPAIALWPVTLLVGLAVLWLAWRRLTGRLRVFVMMIGGSLVLFVLSAFLHNGVAWLAGVALGRPDVEEPLFFLVAVILCPLALLVGIVGAAVTRLRRGSVPR
jgi:hypothetical protein